MAREKGKGSGSFPGRELLLGLKTFNKHRGPRCSPERGGKSCPTLWCSGSHQESQNCCHIAWFCRGLVAAFAWMRVHGEMDRHHQLHSCRAAGWGQLKAPSFLERSRTKPLKAVFSVPGTHFGSCNVVPQAVWNRLFLLSLNSHSRVLAGQQGQPSQRGCQAEWFGLCWCCLMVITKRIFQDRRELQAETARKPMHNLPYTICSKNWNQNPKQQPFSQQCD